MVGRSQHTLPALGLGLAEQFTSPGSPLDLHYIKLGRQLEEAVQDLLGEDGVLLYPSHPTPAPHHTQPIVKTFNWSYTAIWNVLGLPVTQVPLGLGGAGLPLGVQVVAGRNMDRLGIAVAQQAERMFGGWVPPSPSLSQ